MLTGNMDTVVAVAIAVLAAVFLGSLILLIFICRHRFCRRNDLFSSHTTNWKPDVHLISENDLLSELELEDVDFKGMETFLRDARWIDDASGLVPHALAVLRSCHLLTERLVAMTCGRVRQQSLGDVIKAARGISPRVDDMVKCMYPPLDPRLLEARSSALVLAVTNLALVTKFACRQNHITWIQSSLEDVEQHLRVLREAALQQECDMKMQSQANNASEAATPESPRGSQ